jgi:hypothetical protein
LKGVFTAQLHNNESCAIVACVFVAAGMYLQSHCLAMDVSSDLTIPAFGRHVTVFIMIRELSYLFHPFWVNAVLNGVVVSDILTKLLYAFIAFVGATCPSHLILLPSP